MKIIHISDLHFSYDLPLSSLKSLKILSGYLNYKLRRRRKFPNKVFYKLINFVENLKADIIIFSGDITNFSTYLEFENSRKQLKNILNEKIFMIPGNHDRYISSSVFEKDLYEDFYGEYSGTIIDENFYVKIKKINDLYLVGIDSSRPNPILDASGYIPSESILSLIRTLKKLRIKKYILVSHHPIINPYNEVESFKHKMINREEILSILKSYPPILYLHGHEHKNSIRKKDENIPFYIINSAATTYLSKKKKTGFHLIEEKKTDGFNLYRYEYCVKKENFQKAELIYFKEYIK